MNPKRFLVIGAYGFAGTATIAAIRAVHPNAHIVATSSRDSRKIHGADEVIKVELTAENTKNETWIEPLTKLRPFEATFFCFAYSDAVGYTAHSVTTRQRRKAYHFSVQPLETMERWGGFGTLVFFSSYLWLSAVRRYYGAMYSAKRRLEAFYREQPGKRQLIRFGAAENSSLLKGVAVAVLNRLKRSSPYPELLDRASIFSRLLQLVTSEERKEFMTEGLTTRTDLEQSIEHWLRCPIHGIRNVVGDMHWVGDTKPAEPSVLRALSGLSKASRRIYEASDLAAEVPVHGEFVPMPAMI